MSAPTRTGLATPPPILSSASSPSPACPFATATARSRVLSLHNSKLDLLPDSSISFLRVLCDYAAIALQNAAQVKLIHDLSITDDCTGLFNARYLYNMIEEEIAAAGPAPDSRVVSIRRAGPSLCSSLTSTTSRA